MKRLVLLLGLCSVGCSTLGGALTKPAKEPPASAGETYLSTQGPPTKLDVGPGEKLLLDDFVAMRAAKLELESKVEKLGEENASLRSSLAQTERERNEAQRMRAADGAELERQRRLLRERDARILTLSLEKARLEQETLALRIAALQKQLEEMATPDAAAAAAAPAPGGDR